MKQIIQTIRPSNRIRFFLAAVCVLILPSISFGDLRQMDEKEMKAVYINDFRRPSLTPVIVGPAEKASSFEQRTEVLPLAAQANPISFDAEGLARDLETQYQHMMEGGKYGFPIFSNYQKTN